MCEFWASTQAKQIQISIPLEGGILGGVTLKYSGVESSLDLL